MRIFHGNGKHGGELPSEASKKNLDLIVANNLKEAGAGFGTDTNVVTLISKEASIQLPIMSKEEVAERLLSHILDTMNIL